jgi:sialate O-acetylesterase
MRQRVQRLSAAWALILVIAPVAGADVKLPAIIGDNMCLQQGITVPLWGLADPGEDVTVSLAGQKVAAKTGADGRWQVRLEPLKAGGPLEMTVAGKNRVRVANILVGEVWVCSGQSNMAMSVKSSKDSDKEIAEAKFPKIRLFKVAQATADQPQKDVKGEWTECSPDTVGGFSAVGYFFGRDIHKALGVPVGLIHTNWGGTPAEAWTSRETLEADPAFKAIYDRRDRNVQDYLKAKENWDKTKDQQMARWEEAGAKAKAEGKPAPKPPQAPAEPKASPHWPSVLYNAMIAPLVPYGIAGAIWYQGESNADRAYKYRQLFPAMITDWRRHWGEGDFPFLFVQLANFKARKAEPAESDWAELREAQAMTLALPKTGMAVIIDIGEAGDIHPKNKQDVGVRLGLAAQAVAYGRNIVYSGPMYESMKIEQGKVRLKFTHTGGGLAARGDRLTGFAVAGEDKKFVWADAAIEGDSVVVSSKEVAKPVAVRYGWADNPDCNLYNKEGIPASPFRTDDWPGVTAPKAE